MRTIRRDYLEELVSNTNNGHSAWSKGVKETALTILEGAYSIETFEEGTLKKTLLNGAMNWKEWAYSGNGLVYNQDIAELLCNATELKMAQKHDYYSCTTNGETMLDIYARACYQAYMLILEVFSKNAKEVA
jgi:hypothetical protein